MSVHEAFIQRLRQALASAGPLKVTAARSGYSAGYISSLVHGRVSNPTIGTVWALAGALDVDPLWLLGANVDQPLAEPREHLGLTASQWATIDDWHGGGATWSWIAAEMGVNADTLRGLWSRRKRLQRPVEVVCKDISNAME